MTLEERYKAEVITEIIHFYNTKLDYRLDIHMWALHEIEFLDWDYADDSMTGKRILFLRFAEDAAIAKLKFG